MDVIDGVYEIVGEINLRTSLGIWSESPKEVNDAISTRGIPPDLVSRYARVDPVCGCRRRCVAGNDRFPKVIVAEAQRVDPPRVRAPDPMSAHGFIRHGGHRTPVGLDDRRGSRAGAQSVALKRSRRVGCPCSLDNQYGPYRCPICWYLVTAGHHNGSKKGLLPRYRLRKPTLDRVHGDTALH